VRRRSAILLALLPVLLAAACGCRRTDRPKLVPAEGERPGRTRVTVGSVPLWIEIADDEAMRARGLMFRRELPEDEGMLFVFEYPHRLSFWMKDTHLPLDIAFLSDDLRILNIEAMRPLDEGPRYVSRGPARYAVETNQGWFNKNGVKPGDTLSFR